MVLLSKSRLAGFSKCDRGGCAPSFSAQVRFGEPGAPVLFLLGSAVTQTPPGLIWVGNPTQDYVLDYAQPYLSKLAFLVGGRPWLCRSSPSTSTNAKVGHRPPLCHPDRRAAEGRDLQFALMEKRNPESSSPRHFRCVRKRNCRSLPSATPDFLSNLVAPANFMRLSLPKAAHVAAGQCRVAGNPAALRSG